MFSVKKPSSHISPSNFCFKRLNQDKFRQISMPLVQQTLQYPFVEDIQYAATDQLMGTEFLQFIYPIDQLNMDSYPEMIMQNTGGVLVDNKASLEMMSEFKYNLPDGLLTPPLTPKDQIRNEIKSAGVKESETTFEFNIDEYIKPLILDQYNYDADAASIVPNANTAIQANQITNTSKHNNSSCQYYQNDCNSIIEDKIRVTDFTEDNKDFVHGKWTRSSIAHNTLERKRRTQMKKLFTRLRYTIPGLIENEKSPKIMILTQAKRYLDQLKYVEQRLLADRELEVQRNFILNQKIFELSSSR